MGWQMWKPEHRVAADRRGLRYPSDMTDEEWAEQAKVPRAQHVESLRRGW